MRLAAGILGLASILFASAPSTGESTVVLGGAGASPYLEEALDKIAGALVSAGIKPSVAPGGSTTRTALLDSMKNNGYRNLLYVTLENPDGRTRGQLVAGCFVDGEKVWEEKSKGPLIMVPRPVDEEIKNMQDDVARKIGKRAGGPCLPRA